MNFQIESCNMKSADGSNHSRKHRLLLLLVGSQVRVGVHQSPVPRFAAPADWNMGSTTPTSRRQLTNNIINVTAPAATRHYSLPVMLSTCPIKHMNKFAHRILKYKISGWVSPFSEASTLLAFHVGGQVRVEAPQIAQGST